MPPSPPLVPVILSGGAGTRLWPLSREAAPKPFMPLPDGETLLAKTAARALAQAGAQDLIVVTNRDHYFPTRDVIARQPGRAPRHVAYLLEPFGRNTAPAVAIGALYAQRRYGDDAVLLALPADHLIRDTAAFAAAVARAAAIARGGRLVTFGIAPTRPETGYGYIECGDALDDATPPAHSVRRFVEKPPLEVAQDFLAEGSYAWNSGMFCFTAAAIVAAFGRHAPAVLGAVRPAADALAAAGDASMLEIDPALFAAAPPISIDYAVMEKAAAAGEVACVRGAFDWSDVGSWDAISALVGPDADGNRTRGECVAIHTRGTFVHAEERVVATVGVSDLVIVETADAVLVAHRDRLQQVKDVAVELKRRGHESYRLHRTVSRPWGAYTVVQEGPGFKIKRIEVKPGGALSLQRHRRRSEHWVVVHGVAQVTCGERRYAINANESTFIPVGEKHRLENAGPQPLVMIEVQCGEYVGEDDIERFDDRYERPRG